MNLIFNPTQAKFGSLFSIITVTIVGAVIFLKIATTFLSSGIYQLDFVVYAPMVAVFLNFAFDFMSIYTVLAASISWELATLIFSPFLILYFLGVLEWWRGVST
jgi:hypothetical protein